MIYAFLIAALLAGVGGFYGGYSWESGRWASAENARLEAEAKIAAQAKTIEDQAANAVLDMQAAYDYGEANAKTVEKKIYVRVASAAATDGALKNTDCTINADSLALLTATLKGVRTGVVLPAEGSPAMASTPAAPPPTTGRPPKPVPKKKATP